MLRYSADGKARDRFRVIYESPEWLLPYEHREHLRFPFILSVEPTNHCNNDCLYCSRQLMTRPRGFMALETMEAVAREAGRQPTPVAIRFGGMGEPLLHPKFVELVKIAKSYGLLAFTFTNGRFLTEEKMAQLVEAGLDEIRFSSAGLDAETHQAVRLKSDYRRDFLEKIQMARRLRDRSPQRTPYLSVLTHVLAKGDGHTEAASRYCDTLLQWVDKVAVDLTDYNHVQDVERAKPFAEACGVERVYQPCVELLLRKAVWWDGTIVCCDTYWDASEEAMVLGHVGAGDTIAGCYASEKMARLLADLGQEPLKHAEYPICRRCYRITDRYEPMKQALRQAGP